MKNSNKKLQPNIMIYQIILGFAGTILVAYFGYLGIRTQVETPIRATQTAEAKLTELASSVNSNETATVIPTVTAMLKNTPVTGRDLFIEDFSKGSQYWELGTEDSDCKTASLSIANNVLHWQLTAKMDCKLAMGYPKLPISSNIDLEATFNLINSNSKGIIEYGLIFRRTDYGSYRFYISTIGNYALFKYIAPEDKSIKLIDWAAPSTPININSENKLRVLAIKDSIRIYINDNLVGDIIDNTFSSGQVDVVANMEEGEKLTLDISSFKLEILPP